MSSDNIQSHCNTCGINTDQIVLHEETSTWNDEDANCDGGTALQMVKCAGCKTISMRSVSWHSEFTDDYGAPQLDISPFPPSAFRKVPAWHSDLQLRIPNEKTISQLLSEIYVALQYDLLRLAAMGIRSLLEHIMIDKIGDKGSFGKNLTAFFNAGHISQVQKGIIEPVLDAGHASIHRGFRPNPETLIQLIEISESLVHVLYIQGHQAAAIKAVTPKRKPYAPNKRVAYVSPAAGENYTQP